MKKWLKNSRKSKAITVFVILLAVQNFTQLSFADFSQEELNKKIEELIHKPHVVDTMDRNALESLRSEVKKAVVPINLSN